MKYHDGKDRCSWANPKNPIYIEYHDKEWGVPVYDDHKLFEMLILESFQAGLSWECVLNKREAFREAFGELYEQLKDQGFAQAHYSYIVNLGKVEGLEKGVLRLKCGIELNVSRAKKEEFTEALFEYLRERNG